MTRRLLSLWWWFVGRCPRCGSSLVERPVGFFAQWIWVCPRLCCGYWRNP